MVSKLNSIEWGARSLSGAARSRLRCGPLLVELSRDDDEICLASKTLSEEEISSVGQRDPVRWNRWAACNGNNEVCLLPGLPDRPLLVDSESELEIPAGGEVRIFIRVPLSVVVKVPGHRDQLLAELPTEPLSRIRAGRDGEGEACYALPAGLLHCELPASDESGVQVPVRVRNEGPEVLQLSRLRLQVGTLSIYRSGGLFWSNETVLRFRGRGREPSVSVKSGPPPEAGGAAVLLSEPRDGELPGRWRRFVRSLRRAGRL